MLAILKKILCIPSLVFIEAPVIGCTYLLNKHPDDPFDMSKPVRAFVSDVKQGWVKYYFGDCAKGNARTMPIYRFNSIYTKENK